MTARDTHQPHPVDTHGDPLTFALSGLMAEPPGTVREYEIEAVAADAGEGLVLTEPVGGRLRLLRTNRGLVVDARLATPVQLRIDEEVLPSIDFASGLPVPLEEGADPEAPRLTDHHELELRPLVAAAISLAEPIAPLCEPDCPGLCPECGQRVEPGHPVHDEPIDPRLEALLAFRVDGDADSG